MASRMKGVQLDLDKLGMGASFALLLDADLKVAWGNPSILEKVDTAIGRDSSEFIRFFYPSSQKSRKINPKSISSKLGKQLDLILKTPETPLYLSGRWIATRNGYLLLADRCPLEGTPPSFGEREVDTVMNQIRTKQQAKEKLVQATSGGNEKRSVERDSLGLSGWNVFDHIAGIGISIADSARNLVYCNEYMAKAHGLSVAEVIGKNLSIFHTREQMKHVERLNRKLLRDDGFSDEEVPHVDRKGKEFSMLMNGSVIRTADRTIRYLSVSAIDITERKKGEGQLVLSENRYRSLLSNLPVGVFRTTPDANFISVNPTMARMHGYESEGELLNKRTTDFWIDANQREELLERLQRDSTVENFPVAIRPIKGPILQTIISVRAVRNSSGNILYLDGIMLDVTARKTAEKTLDEYTRKLKIINTVVSEGNRAEDIPTFLRNVLNIALDLMEFSGGGIYLVDEKTRTARLACHIGLDEEFVQSKSKIPIDAKPYSEIFLAGNTIATSDYSTVNPKTTEKRGQLSIVSTPLIAGKKIVGALNLATMTMRPMSAMTKETFCSIGKELGTAIARMQTDQELRNSEERFRTTFRLSPDALYLETVDGRIVDVNPMAEKMTGYSRKELLSMHAHDLVTEEIAQKLKTISMESNFREPLFLESVNIHKDGTHIPVEVHIQSIGINQNDYILVEVRDLTERKKAEEEGKRSETLLKSVIEQSPVPMVVASPDGAVAIHNHACREILGGTDLSPENRDDGNPAWVNYDTDGNIIPFKQHPLWQSLLGKKTIGKEMRFVRGDGTERWQVIDAVPIRDEDGKIIAGFTIFPDITDRKKMEEALRESERRFRESTITLETVLNSIPDIIGVQDRHHSIIRYNAAGHNLLNLSPEEVEGKKCFELIGRDTPCETCATSLVYETEKPVQVERFSKELGLWLDVRAYPIIDDSGKIIHVIEHMRDITVQKEAQRKLIESEKKYRLLVENQTDLIVELDRSGNFLFASPSFCHMFDTSEEALLGRHLSRLGYGPGKETLLKLVRDLREHPHSSYVEQQEKTRDGLKWFTWALKAVPGTDGIPDSIIAVGRDITRRKRQEIELKSSEERLRILFEYAPDACFLIDMTGTFVDGNRAVRELLGYSKKELAGRNLLDLEILPLELFQTPENQPTGPDGSSTTSEHQARHKDGGQITAETHAYPVHINGQSILLCVSRDITARKLAETERTKLLASIRERVMELNCLYKISGLSETAGVSIEEILPVIVETIPSAFPVPSIACARIALGDREFVTENWVEKPAKLWSDIRFHGEKTGRIDVCCLEEKSVDDHSLFIKEKQDLIEEIAKRLGTAIERNRAEEDLAHSERLYRTLIETVDHVIWLGETDGRITFFNSAWEKTTGRMPEDSYGMKWSESIHPDDMEMIIQKWEAACKHGERFQAECRFLSKEGDWRTIHCTASPVRDNFGEIVKWVGLNLDITDRRLAEEESRKTHALLDSIIENLPSMLCVKDSNDLKYIRLNRAGEELLGYSRDELAGRTSFEIFPAQDALTSTYDDRKVLQSEMSADFREEMIQTRYKGLRTLQTKKIPLLNDAGEPEYLLSISQDITERKLADEAFRLQSEILENMVEGVCLIRSLDATIVYVNPAFENMCAYEPGELVNKHAGVLDVPLTSARENRSTDMILSLQKKSTWNGEVHNRKKDDSTFWSRVNVSTFDHPRYGRVWVAVIEDITEQKMLQMQLLQAQKLEAVGQLASGIAHEINTPIQYVGDNTHFLSRSLEDLLELFKITREIADSTSNQSDNPELYGRYRGLASRVDMNYLLEEIPKAAQHSIEGIEHVSEIVQAMREFSHPSVKEKSMVDLNRLIRTTLTFTKNEWKYIAKVETNLDSTLPMIPCIPGEFTQAIMNLVVNSTHAIRERYGETSDRKGVITICSRLDEEWVEISVADTGVGIPDEHRHRIFDPFFTTKEVGKGSGQGLAIVHSVVVDKHRGTLSFESEEGNGSTFIIRLPLIDSDTPTEVDHEGEDSLRG